MKNCLVAVLLITIAVPMLVTTAFTEEQPTSPSPAVNTASDTEAAYTHAIEGRTADILALLQLTDTNKLARVHDAIIAQYRGLRSWHDANDSNLKALNRHAETNQQQIADIKASLKTLHNQFLSKLSKDLTPEQVEKVKDKMTYNKVQVTYNAYCQMLPALTEEQKAKVLEWLKEAREEAMDCGSSEEKSTVFNKYKGRINNYLSKQGHDLAKASRELSQKPKANSESGAGQPAK